MGMWGNVLVDLRKCIGKMELGKEMWKEEDYCSFVMKKSCAWQTSGSQRIREEK